MDIRLHLLMVFLIGFWLLEGLTYGGLGGLVRAAVLIACLMGLILWHELGHAFAARHYGLPVHGIMLWPLGGECQIGSGMPSPRVELVVALAGPAAHGLLVVATAIPVLLLLPATGWFSPMYAASGLVGAWSVAVYILAFNLVPMFPLDGGRVLRALLSPVMGDVRATLVAVRVSQALAGLLVLAGLVLRQLMLAVIGGFIIMSAENELRTIRYVGYVYDPAARSFLVGDDWSRASVESYGRGEKKPGFFARWRTRRQLKRLARETERRQRLKAEVDRILEKVSREGMPSLTAGERKILKQASSEYKKH